MKKHDFIAIGDVVTDEFIKLKDAAVHCKLDNEQCELCVRFGDKVPYESVETVHAVGNAANAAVSATRLGLSTAFVGDVGDDELGEKILETLSMNDVSTELVAIHEGKESNHHYVLQYGAERTILVKHQAYNRTLPDVGDPAWVYLSSLGEDSLDFHASIASWLDAHPNTKLAFQPGTFQLALGADKLKDIYTRTHIFFCNKDEAARILGKDSVDTSEALRSIAALGPTIVVVTDGPRGAHAYDSTTGETWHVPMYPDPKEPVDRTGAGDALASTTTAALALGKPLNEALLWGPVNSMSVVQEIGAQKGLLSREALEEILAHAPESYAATKVQ